MVPRSPEERKAAEQRVRENFQRRFAATADKYRDRLVELYGEQGRNIRYAEAFEICEYGRQPDAQEIRRLFPFYPNPN
jgi:hypothetical protein